MKVFRWGVCAVAALLMAAGSSFASDSEIDAMKSAMDNMKQEMDAMRATMSAEREAMRESAGGAPEALRTKGGNATVRIGGAVVVRYYANFRSNDQDEPTGNTGFASGGGEYAKKIGWTMDTAKIDFDVQISEDISAYIDIRPNKFDKAYFQWNNIGGTTLGGQIGYIGIPGGMYSTSFDPTGAVFINNPFTKSYMGDADNGAGVSPEDDISRMGAKMYYTIADQIKITGAIYNPLHDGDADLGAMTDDHAITQIGDVRNPGINHSLMVEYSPAFMEGLHFSFVYTGLMDTAETNVYDGTYQREDEERGTAYRPQFDLGVAYIADKFSVWATGDYTYAPDFYSNTGAYALSVGGSYNITERFAVAVGGDYAYANTNNDMIDNADGSERTAYAARMRVGAKYTLCNGIWLKGEYGHTFYGDNIPHRAELQGADSFVFETGVSF